MTPRLKERYKKEIIQNLMSKLNYKNINKSLMFEFMKCEIDSTNIVFNNYSCGNSNPPPTSMISTYINKSMNIKTPTHQTHQELAQILAH